MKSFIPASSPAGNQSAAVNASAAEAATVIGCDFVGHVTAAFDILVLIFSVVCFFVGCLYAFFGKFW